MEESINNKNENTHEEKHEFFQMRIDNMEPYYMRKMKWEFTSLIPDRKDEKTNQYIELLPELKSRLCKFGIGILQWELRGLIDIGNPEDISRIRMMLRILDRTPGFDFFDQSFNQCPPDMVFEIIGINPMNNAGRKEEIKFDYYVVPIKDFKEANVYADAVSWCIVISEESYNLYTATGNKFYFCFNDDWPEVPCEAGANFPHDRYGYSMIAVEVSPQGEIVSVTSRWNTCSGDTGDFLSVMELKQILGDKYAELFK